MIRGSTPEIKRLFLDVSDSRYSFLIGLLAALVIGGALRFAWPTADPPTHATVGIVWHDEGAWVHNARNRALWGVWSLDAWNPMYVAPVFTLLEYASFVIFGVGVWQARLVSELGGLLSVGLLALGVRRIAGDKAGIIAAALLATNYVYVMYNRAALMETTMVAFIVAGWYCYVRAQSGPAWGVAAGLCATLAFFTKAAAAFFVAALALDALVSWVFPQPPRTPSSRRAAVATLAGLAAGAILALALFVGPHWADYQFYNWQMSVTRKPSYDVKSLVDRVTWFPVVHDVFTRAWLVLVVATLGALVALARWHRLEPGERLLLWWLSIGTLELLVHDVGNERRFLFLIPALAALAAVTLGRGRATAGPELTRLTRRRAAIALPAVAFACYVVAGAIVRVLFLYEVRPNVRLAAGIAAGATVLVYGFWPRLSAWITAQRWTPVAALALTALACAGDLAQFGQWAAGRTYKNVTASIELREWLPPGTQVHGKLANGLSLENRIRPVFVGRNFGNYADRKERDDVRYILTYIAPQLGYESQASNPVIVEVLDAYPNHRIIRTFDVAETTSGHDRAALIDKFGTGVLHDPSSTGARAQH